MIKSAKHPPVKTITQLQALEPTNDSELHRFVQYAFGLNVPRRPIIEGNTAPFDYLSHAYFEPTPSLGHNPTRDAVVWANRGGGKTMLGAAATLLDMLFKPGIQISILGGSFEQSCKMHDHLLSLVDRPWFRHLLRSEPTQRYIELINGSRVRILAGSQRSIRGVRVHKLRCDEVEEFQRDAWEAAQLVTRSGFCGEKFIHGCVEALSTMHRPFGLMAEITHGRNHEDTNERKLFRWSAIDVIENCSPFRSCDSCELWQDCQGRAKHARGFVAIDDLIHQKQRTSIRTWAAEMMCQEPEVSHCVYAEFDNTKSIRSDIPEVENGAWIGGMDFGLRNPTVMLWARVGPPDHDPTQRTIHIIDEYIKSELIFDKHLEAIHTRAELQGWPRVDWLGADPAGNQRNSHSGVSDVQVLRTSGYTVRTRQSHISDGIERIRRRLDHGTLFIHPRCQQLIKAIQTYHYDVKNPHREEPIKDGPDHLCDALRYMVVNLELGSGKVVVERY